MNIASLKAAYDNGTATPCSVLAAIYDQIDRGGQLPVWISLVDRADNLERARTLESDPGARALPLYGIPFAVKDNFDVAGMTTTAACPDFAHAATETARVIEKLLDAGAVLIGKTNMDQFATGLVGTRTPYGICSSVFDDRYVSGGSSSGSAVAVGCGLVSFALGTDTAGSGRVPAAFNQLVGLKPTRGWLSTHGLLPACRTLDCVSIFAETCADASRVFTVARGYDAADPYSRVPAPGQDAVPWSAAGNFHFGVPSALEFFGDDEAATSYEAAATALNALGGVAVQFDYTPFRQAADLLYNGPWVAERVVAIRDFLASDPETLDPTVKSILQRAQSLSAVDAFEGAYALKSLAAQCSAVWSEVDLLLLPTTPTHYTIAQVQADPIRLNSKLGYYTNFVNLLDLAAVAVPSRLRHSGLPFGVSLIGRAFSDQGLLHIADRLHRELAVTMGGSQRKLAATPALEAPQRLEGCMPLAVVGAHLTGQPLNWQLTERKARLIRLTRTHGDYRLYALMSTTPPKPGLVYSPGFCGDGIEVEVWAMPEGGVGSFLNAIPPPLGLGTIHLSDGSMVKGFICEPSGLEGAREITHWGGWRKYLASRSV